MPKINRYARLPFEDLGGGADEGSPPDKAKFRVCENVRDSEGGLSKIKRPGLTKLDSTYDFGTKNVYGCFGIGEVGAHKLLALLEDDIQYKSGGSWGSIFSPSNTIDVPVSVVKDKGLTIVTGYEKPITVLAGSAFYSGIVAPTKLLEVHPQYPTTVDEDDCSTLVGWTENNSGNMDAQQTSFGGKSCFHFVQTGAANPADYVTLTQTYGVLPKKRFKVTTSLYFDLFQHASGEVFRYKLNYSTTRSFAFCSDGYRICVDTIIPSAYGNIGIELVEDKWYDLEFYVDTELEVVDVYVTPDGGSRTHYGQFPLTASGTGLTEGEAYFYCSGHYLVSSVYMDYINVYKTEKADTAGSTFKYGCTFARGGNYPCESNPTEAVVLGDFHFGSGLDDLTAGGSYSAREARVIMVWLDGTGTPDTIKVSYDAGKTWSLQALPIESTMYLQHGVTLSWAATTGHTVGDCWIIACPVAAISKHADELTQITNIPTSSESEVNERKLYRTLADFEDYYWLYTIGNNTTTSYLDQLKDADLSGSDLVSYESYPPPEGEDCEVWDGKLWVTRVPGYPEALFKSRTGKLEQFPSPATSFFPLREDETDEVMKISEYRNNLYAVKFNSIWILTKSGDDILTDKIVQHTGSAAKGSVVVTDRGLMMLTNHYRIGVFDGWKMILPEISDKVKNTLASINKDYAYRSTAEHDTDNKIYYLSIPTGSNQYPDTTIAFQYTEGKEKFFIDKFHQNITSISLTDSAEHQRDLLLGTKDGEIYKLDPSATTDDGTIITSRFKTGLIGSEHWKRLREMFFKYYVPTTILIEDDFNDNNLTGWSTFGGVAAANMRLEVSVDNEAVNGADYIYKSITDQKELSVRFRFLIKSLDTWTNGKQMHLVYIYDGGACIAKMRIRNDGGTTKLDAAYFSDGFVWQTSSFDKELFVGQWYDVRIYWKAAMAPGANNGIFRVWVDKHQEANVTNGDTDTYAADELRFGDCDGTSYTKATLYHDDILVSIDRHTNLKIYKDVKETPSINRDYPGRTPSGGDTALRKFIQRRIKPRVTGSYFSVEFGNAENVADWEVMSFILYARTRGPKGIIKPS